MQLIPYAQELASRQRGCDFQGLDSGFQHVNYLCNGLDTGLFVLAAPPGEGKTTWVWQVCCQVAERERVPVLFLSFEQSAAELRDKALARLGRLEYRHLRRGRLWAEDPETGARLHEALTRYARLGRHLTIVEGDDTMTVGVIRELVAAKRADVRATRCLLAIDYLQILPLAEAEAGRVTSPKDKVDLHVSALRRLARDLGCCVLCISSENRAGYGAKALSVFKESGAIEYSSDIAAVLTRDRRVGTGATEKYRAEDLSIIKNRNGECGVVKFKFYATRAEFVETERGVLPADDG